MQSRIHIKTVLALALVASLVASLPAQAADVGVSIGISQPGVYGRIDIGRFPQPVLIVQQPVIIERPAVYVASPPIYLWVPPGHQKNWRKHCSYYNMDQVVAAALKLGDDLLARTGPD